VSVAIYEAGWSSRSAEIRQPFGTCGPPEGAPDGADGPGQREQA
jgi:hypothetical protein